MDDHAKSRRLPSQFFDCMKTNLESYGCENCDTKFNTIIDLNIHVHENHFWKSGKPRNHILRNYICKKCSFQTHSTLHQIRHMKTRCQKVNETKRKRIKNKQKKYHFCPKCPYKTTWKNCFDRHLYMKHTNPKEKIWLQCDKCTYKSTEQGNFKRHIIGKHTDSKDKKWLNCDKCSYRTTQKSDFKKHFFTVHTVDTDEFECEECGFKTIWKVNFTRHLCKKIKCDECDFKSRWRQDLIQHKMAKHTSEKEKKWLKCDKCPFKTTWNSSFWKHKCEK